MISLRKLKRTFVGNPIATKHAHHERLPKVFGLPVFASDALSSVAYASEEMMLVLVAAGAVGLGFLLPTSLWLGVLMLIVGFSYYQTIHAYPQGGGTYMVSTENLGSVAGRTAGAALLLDYVLTVAVSVSSGVSAIVSMYPPAQSFSVLIGVAGVAAITLVNLRGVRESGVVFAIPTYTFVLAIIALVLTGLARGWNEPHHPYVAQSFQGSLHAVTGFLLLRAFAASCTALTGTEAIADGVQAFRPPEARNASATLVWMIGLLLTMVVGLSWCAQHFAIVPMHVSDDGYKTVVAQLAEKIWGIGPGFYLLQVATALILFLAANTAFADFPRLSSFVARDGFLPRQLTNLGDRLVFQNGILTLSAFAIALIVVYKADTHSLIPLYAMGVFVSFTLSQAGMTMRWFRQGKRGWQMMVNAVGTVTTTIVAGILLVTKWSEGAWLIVVALGVLLYVFARIRRHYNYLEKALEPAVEEAVAKPDMTVLLLVPSVHRGILHAVAYAKQMAHDCRALHVTMDPRSTGEIKREWNTFAPDLPLVILESPYRSLTEPILQYVDETIAEHPNAMVTVIVPEAVPKYPWHAVLHNNVAERLKKQLGSRPKVVITNVRYFLP